MLYQSALYLPFLIGCWVVHRLLVDRPQWRAGWLALSSLAFLTAISFNRLQWGTASVHLLGMGLTTLGSYAWAAWLRRAPGRVSLSAAILYCLLPLALYKYLPPPVTEGIWAWAVPLGISYFSFKQVHFLVESARGHYGDARLPTYLAYIFFFPMFAAGPIERYANFASQLERNAIDRSDFSIGIERILLGAAKKFLLADLVFAAFVPNADMSLDALRQEPWGIVWLACFARFLMTYADFSGYTDMALGTARLFGIRLMENFNFPLLRSNLAEFWRAWHISLSSFARDYVYLPLLGATRLPSLALIASMASIGLWHAGNPGWLLWGLHHGVGLALLAQFHRHAPRSPRLQRLRAHAAFRPLATFATWTYITLGYALTFRPEQLSSALSLYGRLLFPWGTP